MGRSVTIGSISLPVNETPPELQHLVPGPVDYTPQGDEMTALAVGRKYHRHVLLMGGAGTGKDRATEYFCHLLNIPRVVISIAEGTGIDQLIGSVQPESDGKGGLTTVWYDGALPFAIRHGALLVLDELTLGEDRTLGRLNDFLATGDKLFIYENPRMAGQSLSPWRPDGTHNGFQLVGTGNPPDSGYYSGAKQLNAAFLDRWLQVEMTYIGLANPDLEAQEVARQAQVKVGKARRIVDVFNVLRRRTMLTPEDRAAGMAPIYCVPSMRRAVDVALLSKDMPIVKAFEMSFTTGVNREDRATVQQVILDQFASDDVQRDMG